MLLGIPAGLALPRLPDEDWLPPEELEGAPPDCDGVPEGIEEPEPPRPPEEGDGMLGELRPDEPPELPDEPLRLEDPPEEPLGGEDVGEGIDDEDC